MQTPRPLLKRIFDFFTAHAHGHHVRGEGGQNVTLSNMDFPRIWQYAGTDTNGSPWLSGGAFNMSIMNGFAKFHLAVFGNVPWSNIGWPASQQACSLIKSLNPRIKILMYDPWEWKFPHFADGNYSDTQYGDFWHLLNGPPDIRIYRVDGAHYPSSEDPGINAQKYWWDMGQPGAATAAANIWKTHCTPMISQGLVDGYFLDSMLGVGGPAYPDPAAADYTRAPLNYANLAALEAAVLSGTVDTLTQLKATGGLVFVNRGGSGIPDARTVVITGEMCEGWDLGRGSAGDPRPPGFGQFSSYDDAMTKLGSMWRGPTPTGDGTLLIKSEVDAGNSPTITPNSWSKNLRYGLGSACILGGLQTMWIADHDPAPINWVADEYSVLPNGVMDPTCKHMGWLGRPLDYGYKDSGGCWVRYFQNGVVAVNGNVNATSINLGKPYRRLTGTVWPTINNGTVEQTATLAQKDGRFWVNYP